MNRKQLGRIGVLAAAGTLIALQLATGLVSAGRTTSKTLLVGSSVTGGTGVNDPGPNAAATDPLSQARLTFKPNPASAGEQVYFDVVVKNGGGQTLNNVSLTIGRDGTETVESYRPITATSPLPAPAVGLAAGVSFASWSNTVCDQVDGADGRPFLSCNIGQLAKTASFSVQIVLNTTTAATSTAMKATARSSENANDSGTASNQDTFAAEGTITLQAATCDGVAGWLPAGQAKQFGTSSLSCTDQSLDAVIPEGATTTDSVISLATRTAGPSDDCAAGYTCFGEVFDFSANGGQSLASGTFMTVTVTFYGVIATNLTKLVLVHNGTVITTKNNSKCTSTKVNNCWVPASPPTLDNGTFAMTVQFTSNGPVRGGN